MRTGFRAWLEQEGYKPHVIASRVANCQRVEKYYGDLDQFYSTHRMQTLLASLAYSTDDMRHGRSNPSKIPIDGDFRTGLATLRQAVGLYFKFRDTAGTANPTSDRAAVKGLARQRNPTRQPIKGISPQIVNGDDILRRATAALGIDLPRLVAKSAIWVDQTVFLVRRRQHLHAAWFPDCRRGTKGEPRRGLVDGVRFDDNTMANLAIKLAVFGSRERCTHLHVCHVWPETCYDVRYHTGLANLVLLPAPLAGLSDHHETVAACLRYRSYELFGWHPEEVGPPLKPAGYPEASEWAPCDPQTFVG
jgi:hypothetical protein